MAPLLKENLDRDLKEALKAGDAVRLGTLRLLQSALHNREIEKRGKGGGGELSDEEALEIFIRESKKRREAASLFAQGGRSDLEKKELEELKIIETYLPAQLGEGELKSIIEEAFARVNPASEKDFGKVMGEVTKHTKGRADSAVISRIIKEKLGKN